MGAAYLCCHANRWCVKHYYRNLQQAERLMKQGVDESYAPGVRLDEWEDDGSDAFDGLFKQLQERDWPVWETLA